jgi:hypothetical protein
MKIGDVVRLKGDSPWLGLRPELRDVPMTVVKIHTGSSGLTIAVSTEHGISKWKSESLEVIDEGG